MLKLIKQVFITLLRFCGSLAAKWEFINNESCIARTTLINSNLNEPQQRPGYYSFMIS